MAYATTQQIKDLGFRESQFGGEAEGKFDTYLGRVLDQAEKEVQREVTEASYTAASGLRQDLLAQAELAWATAELYRRRTSVADSDAAMAQDRSGYLRLREYKNLAERYMDIFRERVREFRADGGPEGGASLGHFETGPHPHHSTTSIN